MAIEGIVVGLLAGLLLAGVRRGLANLGRIRLKALWVFPALLAVQLMIFVGQRLWDWLAEASGIFLMVVYGAALVFVWLNRVQPGFYALLVGIAMNFLVMLLNGGKMPVAREMAAMARPADLPMLEQGLGTKHVLMTEATRLPFLADVIPLPPPYPVPQVISLGDVVMNVGICWFLVAVMARSADMSEPFGPNRPSAASGRSARADDA
jgi:hypothetical protein